MNIYPYKMGSQSALALAQALKCKQIRHENSRFIGSPDKLVINWGASKLPAEVLKSQVINKPEAVAIAADKLKSFEAMKMFGVSMPIFTTQKDEARFWIEDGSTVVCRTVLNGHSGEGIVLAEKIEELVEAPLYVYYIPKKQEYRVHVMNNEVILAQRKARRKDVPDNQINWKIRNHDNGFIFAKNEELGELPDNLFSVALDAVNSMGLDFGAVDIIYNDKHKTCYALEVNTAPGLTGENPFIYAVAIERIYGEKKPVPQFKYADLAKVFAAGGLAAADHAAVRANI